MAIITEKSSRRYRVQFTTPRAVHQRYLQILAFAEELGVNLDFSKDFEKWFKGQLDQLDVDLKKEKEKRERETEKSQPAKKVDSSKTAPAPLPFNRELPPGPSNYPYHADTTSKSQVEVTHGKD